MNNNIETPPEEATAPEAEKTELEYVREQAQAKIDAYLSNPELNDQQKIELLDQKIAIQQKLLETYTQEEQDCIQDYQKQHQHMVATFAKTSVGEQYTQEQLDKSIDEIQGRFAQWRLEAAEIISLLEQAKERFSNQVPSTLEEPISEESIAENPTISEPPATEEPEKPKEEPEITTQEQEKNPKITEINQTIKYHQELAEEMRLFAGRIKSDIDNLSPRDISYQPLSRFRDGGLYALRSDIGKILDNIDKLHDVRGLFANNDSGAERALQENLDQLSNDWRSLQRKIEDASEFAGRLRRNWEAYSKSPIDRDHPVARINYQLRQMTEAYDNQKNRLK